jgi:ABC-type dipeptide/oligopeptide/nickel transport system permease component
VVSLVFLLIHLVQCGPLQMMLGEGASQAYTASLRHQYFLELSIGQFSD